MTWDKYFDAAAQGLRPMSDFDWLAIDQKGQIAIFSCAGFGAIPMSVFRHKAQYYDARKHFSTLPVRCDHQLIGPRKPDPSFWIATAKQGLFSYDWTAPRGQYVAGEPYRLIATPGNPLLFTDLPEKIRTWIETIRFDVDFSVSKELFPEKQFRELNL